MAVHSEIATWADLLKVLQSLTPQQLDTPAQVVRSHPVYEHVHEAEPIVCMGTVDELGLLYVRSSLDNRRHGNEVVLFTDGNPFAEDGAIAYECELDMEGEEFFSKKRAVYPDRYTPDQNWTGPAQAIVDKTVEETGDGSLAPICKARIASYDRQHRPPDEG